MDSKLLKKDKLPSFLEHLTGNSMLVAPVREDNILVYRPVKSVSEVELNPGKSVLPPKEWFFQQTEALYRYNTGGGQLLLEELVAEKNAVLYGLHPCDIRSLAVLDAVFRADPADRYYSARRENTVLIGLSCTAGWPECFCTAFGISPVDGEGADIHLTDVGVAYLVEILTPKGKELAAKYQDFSEEKVAGLEEVKKAKEEAIAAQCSVRVDKNVLPGKMGRVFDHPYWEELSRRCLGCGICTYVCPTCHCFDITDVSRGTEGQRLRCWDSCLFRDYTLHTSGHNPRHELYQRLRNRFFHKIKYNYDRYGIEGCVGCGRCVALCPVNIDIREVFTTVGGLSV